MVTYPRARQCRLAPLLFLPVAALWFTSCSAGHAATATSTTPVVASGDLGRLRTAVQDGRRATFKAVYSSTASGGTQTVVYEQAPPRRLLAVGAGPQGATELVDSGSASYICATGRTPSTTCIDLGGGATTPSAGTALSDIVASYDGTSALSTLTSWATPAGRSGDPVAPRVTSSVVDGRPVRCASRITDGRPVTYCVTGNGILASAATPAARIVLTSLTTSPSSSDFGVPSGATVVTLPPGSRRGG